MQAVKDVFGDASGLTINFNMGAGRIELRLDSGVVQDHRRQPVQRPTAGSRRAGRQGATFTTENQEMLDRLSNEKKLLDLEIKRLKIKKEEGGLSADEERSTTP